MGTYNPATFPRRPKNSTFFTETCYRLQLAYYRYEVNTGLYVMSASEKAAFNLIVLGLLAFCTAAIYYCLPRAAVVFLQRLVYHALGNPGESFTGMSRTLEMTAHMLEGRGGVVTSLGDAFTTAVNASDVALP